MNAISKIFTTLIILSMTLGVVGPTAAFADAALPEVHPMIYQIAAETPDEIIRVVIQKADETDLAIEIVESLGGEVIKELEIINAFVALVPAGSVAELAANAPVIWITLDAVVESTGKPVPLETYTVRDEFNLDSFDNNDGIADWKTPWLLDVATVTESNYLSYLASDSLEDKLYAPLSGYETYSDSSDTTTAENFAIINGVLQMSNLESGFQPSIAREVNLYGASDVMLSFVFSVGPGVEVEEDSVVMEISSDGGLTYTTTDVFRNLNGGSTGSLYKNISDYASGNTRIRFTLDGGYDSADEYFTIDNIQIEYNAGSLNPNTYLDTLNVRDVWGMGITGAGIGIAIIDSGISPSKDLNVSRSASFNPSSTTVQDVYGHGTHVAGIAAGDGTDSDGFYMGIAPDAHVLNLKISDEFGMAYESDTVAAMEWILNNKDQYNIRVVNLSIQSSVEGSFNDSAMNVAAEILWFNGIVVVAASGNKDGTFEAVSHAPANDPYIITVGASDEKGSSKVKDDSIADFTSWSYTLDGYYKPDIIAPGKDIISILSKSSDWDDLYPERAVLGGKYFRISGTSMASPMVAGAAALLLQAEPNLTPDQVKYRLMTASNSITAMPYLDVYQAITTPTSESANQGLVPHVLLAKMAMIAYWANTNGEETIDWEAVNWDAVNWNAVNWNAVNWNAVNWNAVNWNAVNWNAVNWNAVNWNAVNWNAVNWNAVNWNAVNWNAVNWNAVNWNTGITFASVTWNDEE